MFKQLISKLHGKTDSDSSKHSNGTPDERVDTVCSHGAQPGTGKGSVSSPKEGAREQQPQQQHLDSKCSVFFARVPPTISHEQLLSVFSCFGQVAELNLFRPFADAKTSKGCGIVHFTSAASAATAKEQLHNQYKFTPDGPVMVVEGVNEDKMRSAVATPGGSGSLFKPKSQTKVQKAKNHNSGSTTNSGHNAGVSCSGSSTAPAGSLVCPAAAGDATAAAVAPVDTAARLVNDQAHQQLQQHRQLQYQQQEQVSMSSSAGQVGARPSSCMLTLELQQQQQQQQQWQWLQQQQQQQLQEQLLQQQLPPLPAASMCLPGNGGSVGFGAAASFMQPHHHHHQQQQQQLLLPLGTPGWNLGSAGQQYVSVPKGLQVYQTLGNSSLGTLTLNSSYQQQLQQQQQQQQQQQVHQLLLLMAGAAGNGGSRGAMVMNGAAAAAGGAGVDIVQAIQACCLAQNANAQCQMSQLSGTEAYVPTFRALPQPNAAAASVMQQQQQYSQRGTGSDSANTGRFCSLGHCSGAMIDQPADGLSPATAGLAASFPGQGVRSTDVSALLAAAAGGGSSSNAAMLAAAASAAAASDHQKMLFAAAAAAAAGNHSNSGAAGSSALAGAGRAAAGGSGSGCGGCSDFSNRFSQLSAFSLLDTSAPGLQPDFLTSQGSVFSAGGDVAGNNNNNKNKYNNNNKNSCLLANNSQNQQFAHANECYDSYSSAMLLMANAANAIVSEERLSAPVAGAGMPAAAAPAATAGAAAGRVSRDGNVMSGSNAIAAAAAAAAARHDVAYNDGLPVQQQHMLSGGCNALSSAGLGCTGTLSGVFVAHLPPQQEQPHMQDESWFAGGGYFDLHTNSSNSNPNIVTSSSSTAGSSLQQHQQQQQRGQLAARSAGSDLSTSAGFTGSFTAMAAATFHPQQAATVPTVAAAAAAAYGGATPTTKSQAQQQQQQPPPISSTPAADGTVRVAVGSGTAIVSLLADNMSAISQLTGAIVSIDALADELVVWLSGTTDQVRLAQTIIDMLKNKQGEVQLMAAAAAAAVAVGTGRSN